jgi:hypothetical protein
MNLHEPFASPVRFTGPAEEFYPIVPVARIFCCEDLFRATRQKHFFELQSRVQSIGDLLPKVVREKYDGIDVIRFLLGRNEAAVNQETMCMREPRQFEPTPKPQDQPTTARSASTEAECGLRLGRYVKSFRQVAVISKVRDHRSRALLGIKRVSLAQIAFLALGLKVVIGCLTTF